MRYSKTSAVFRWLFGYDLTDTLVLVDKRGSGKVTFLVSASKEQLLKSSLVPPVPGLDLKGRAPVEIEILLRSKNNEKQDFDRLAARLKAGTVGGVWNVPGTPVREPQQGAFAEGFIEVIRDESEGIKVVDVSAGVAEAMAVKDTKDINFIRSACSISDVVFKKFVVPKIEEEVNEGKKVSPVRLSEYIEGYFTTPEKISSKLSQQFVESCYAPIFSSQARLDADLTKVENSARPLDYSVIVCGVGSKYKSLCSNVVRTILINPSDRITSAYATVSAAFKAAVAVIRPGAALKDVYQTARKTIAELDGQLAECLDATVGHSMGYEFCESIALQENSEGVFKAGMVFNLMLLLQNVEGKHVIGLADTVLVTDAGSEVLTKATKDGLQYDLEDKQSDGDDVAAKAEPGAGGEAEEVGKRKSRMRDASALTSELELKEKQKENYERLQRELARRAEEGDEMGAAAGGSNVIKDWLRINAYPRGAGSFPNEAAPFRLVVDAENETVLMPINGFVVAVHVSLIKTVTKLDDTIRFQFHVPGKGKMSAPANAIAEEQPNTVWIKEAVYHLQNSNLLASIERSIKEMRKRVTAQEKRKADMAGIQDQDNLVLSREKAPQLGSLYARPSLAGKRVVGTLEAHKNGFRYTTAKGQKLDIIYNNIKHAFFQPAEQEALVILHFNLIHPIVIGKRKTTDVQFVQETMEASSRLDSRRRNYGDADEIEEEQREKLARKKINRNFFKFCKDVEEFSKRNNPEGEEMIKFDFPSRELGFMGVPFKANVLLQPTAQDCLVHLVEGPPFFVLALEDVEVASFERVMFGLRQFDLVFVLKDYSKNPVSINSIPVEALETLQEWLTKSNVLFYLNPQPYNWSMIMQEVRQKSLKEFHQEGGWSFLGQEASDAEKEEGGGGGKDDSEGESDEFAPEGSSSSDESDFEDEEDDEGDDKKGGGSDDEDGGDGEDEDEEEADWDELEKKAERSDKKAERKYAGEKPASAPPVKKAKK